ncbi:WYL domain-containing protein [Nonomuraea sp. NPDC049152]|uniref:helix-turn-helix transcriptional regulator n=1 Tax=Nonomuraea sp. NPDC049152 TaxID=3154350 RepID=UPI00340C1605
MRRTSARLLRLLALLQTRQEWSGTELADRLQVSTRTVRRDIDRLRELDYPVHAAMGAAGGYRLGPGTKLPPLLLEDDEAVAVAVGLRAAAAWPITGVAETCVRALAKLEQVLPSRLRHQVSAISAATDTMPTLAPAVEPATLTAIAAAVRDRHRLRFDYGTGVREVEPYRLITGGRRWYLFAWDGARADWRTFRVDKLTLRHPRGPRFTPRPLPADDLAAYLAATMTTSRHRYQAVLTMYGSAAQLADEVPPTLGSIEPIDERTCTLRIGSDDLDHLAVWVTTFGFDFDVHHPPELLDRLRVLSARLERATRRP